MTIQSTCHPHSQAASSSLLTNEGGGVGEADTGRVAEGDRHTDTGKEGVRESSREAGWGARRQVPQRPAGLARGQLRQRHNLTGHPPCPPRTCSPAKRQAREGQVPPRARAAAAGRPPGGLAWLQTRPGRSTSALWAQANLPRAGRQGLRGYRGDTKAQRHPAQAPEPPSLPTRLRGSQH